MISIIFCVLTFNLFSQIPKPIINPGFGLNNCKYIDESMKVIKNKYSIDSIYFEFSLNETPSYGDKGVRLYSFRKVYLVNGIQFSSRWIYSKSAFFRGLRYFLKFRYKTYSIIVNTKNIDQFQIDSVKVKNVNINSDFLTTKLNSPSDNINNILIFKGLGLYLTLNLNEKYVESIEIRPKVVALRSRSNLSSGL